jgi:hypothetical protein
MFIFNLNVVFTLNFLNKVLSHVRFSPRFLQDSDFPGSNLNTADHIGKNRVFAEQIAPAWFWNSARAVLSRIRTLLEQPARKRCTVEELLWSSRSTLETIPLREILLLREILKSTQLGAIFEKFSVKVTCTLKVTLIRNNLNFTIQPNHQ